MRPININFLDHYGSTRAVMLFPDDPDKAIAWQAQFIARGPLKAFLDDGHSFDVADFLPAVASGVVDANAAARREQAGVLVGEVVGVLHTLIQIDPATASWTRAIRSVANAHGCSENTVRNHLALMAPVLHLWGSWRLQDMRPSLDELWDMAGGLLIGLRSWQSTRAPYRGGDARYLEADEFAPWEGWQGPAEFRVRVPLLDPAMITEPGSAGRPRKTVQS